MGSGLSIAYDNERPDPKVHAAGAGLIDAAISASGRHLFVLNSGSQTISSFTVAKDGSLANLGSAAGLPVGANGLAAN